MSRPNVAISFSNGNLGGVNPSRDGVAGIIVSGVAVGGQFALGDVLKFNSINDAIAKGITAAYDVTNTCMAYKHIADFYSQAPAGSELWVMVVAKTVTMAQMCDKTANYAKKLLTTAAGAVRIIGITRVPDSGYTPTYTTQLEADQWSAITNAKALRADELSFYRPVQFLHEGRDWQGSVSSTQDLRDSSTGPNANRSSIVIGQDADVIATYTWATKYAAVGLALGKLTAIGVQRNMGRVKDGALPVMNAGFSNGAAFSTITDTNLDLLNDKGYIFMTNLPGGISGYFWNDSHTATPMTDDYRYIENGRTIDKAFLITLQTYIKEILDDVEVDAATGRLQPATAKHYQGIIVAALRVMEAAGEIDAGSAKCVCDMTQNVQTAGKVALSISVGKKGVIRKFEILLGYTAAV